MGPSRVPGAGGAQAGLGSLRAPSSAATLSPSRDTCPGGPLHPSPPQWRRSWEKLGEALLRHQDVSHVVLEVGDISCLSVVSEPAGQEEREWARQAGTRE